MKSSAFYRFVSLINDMLMTGATTVFVLAVGLILVIFVLSLPAADVYVQWRGMMSAGWDFLPALALSVGTSAVPFIYSLAGSGSIVRLLKGEVTQGNIFATLLIAVRLIDALLDAMSVGPAIGVVKEPSLSWLRGASAFNVLTVVVVFVLSNVTDEGKMYVIEAAQGYGQFVREAFGHAAEKRSRGNRAQARASSTAGVASPRTPELWGPPTRRGGMHHPG